MKDKSRKVPRRASPPSRRLYREEWGGEEDDPLPETVLSDNELPGTVFNVPDRHWGIIGAVGREDHPGICTAARPKMKEAALVQGRDAATDRSTRRTRFIVDPSLLNGLRKTTSFDLSPRIMSLRRVRLLVPNRRRGVLEPDLLAKLRRRLVYLLPP